MGGDGVGLQDPRGSCPEPASFGPVARSSADNGAAGPELEDAAQSARSPETPGAPPARPYPECPGGIEGTRSRGWKRKGKPVSAGREPHLFAARARRPRAAAARRGRPPRAWPGRAPARPSVCPSVSPSVSAAARSGLRGHRPSAGVGGSVGDVSAAPPAPRPERASERACAGAPSIAERSVGGEGRGGLPPHPHPLLPMCPTFPAASLPRFTGTIWNLSTSLGGITS